MGKKSTTPQKLKDRALDVPAEANRDKHMNYLATPEENLLPDPRKDNRTPLQKVFLKKKKNSKNPGKDPLGTHAPGERHLPDNPRNLPTENTSMRANESKKNKEEQ